MSKSAESALVDLFAAAKAAQTHAYAPYSRFKVGAALRTRDGRIYTGVNLDAYLGRMAVCAEAVALGRAVTEVGETGIETIVAVRHPEPAEADQAIVVVSPCGSCRELIWDYDRNARVIVPSANGPVVAGIGELLPNKYSRERTL